MYIYIYVCTYTHAYTYAHTYTHVHTHTHMYTCGKLVTATAAVEEALGALDEASGEKVTLTEMIAIHIHRHT